MSAWAPEFQAKKIKKYNLPVTVKIRTHGYQTLECFIAKRCAIIVSSISDYTALPPPKKINVCSNKLTITQLNRTISQLSVPPVPTPAPPTHQYDVTSPLRYAPLA